jgi:hypothetical protein
LPIQLERADVPISSRDHFNLSSWSNMSEILEAGR